MNYRPAERLAKQSALLQRLEIPIRQRMSELMAKNIAGIIT